MQIWFNIFYLSFLNSFTSLFIHFMSRPKRNGIKVLACCRKEKYRKSKTQFTLSSSNHVERKDVLKSLLEWRECAICRPLSK